MKFNVYSSIFVQFNRFFISFFLESNSSKMPSVEEKIVTAMKENQSDSSFEDDEEIEEAVDAEKETIEGQEETAEGEENTIEDPTEAVSFEPVPEKASGMSNTITRLLSVTTPNPEVFPLIFNKLATNSIQSKINRAENR
jgi:hypothetical protein